MSAAGPAVPIAWGGWMRRRHPRALLPGLVLGAILAASLGAGVLSRATPDQIALGAPFTPPAAQHFLGLDEAGRDVFTRILYGGRVTLAISFGAMAGAAAAGVFLGMAAGYFRGTAETAIGRLGDVVLSFPPIILAMAIVAFVGSTPVHLALVIAILYVPRFIRIAQAAVQVIMSTQYVEAAHAMGAPVRRIFARVLLPNILGPVMVQFSLGVGHAILLETGLSFVGLGPPPPTPSWGRMIYDAQRYMALQPLLIVWPSLAIAGSVITLNLLGDAVRDVLDPRLRRSVRAVDRR
jgi:peptide/nickel transport system permease protein